ncbi:MAG: hypothetical protein C0596_05860 [Marinilabiliales bacterium]|nr:MAG: hypothetical protein C0596_05860 [Marinilabiliales bacterium]
MKKTILLFSVMAFIVLVSCNNDKNTSNDKNDETIEDVKVNTPEEDVQHMVGLVENFTAIAMQAMQDNFIDDKESNQINQLSIEINDFEKMIDEKYQKDEEGAKQIEKYLNENMEEIELIYEQYYDAIFSLYKCEGSEKINIK